MPRPSFSFQRLPEGSDTTTIIRWANDRFTAVQQAMPSLQAVDLRDYPITTNGTGDSTNALQAAVTDVLALNNNSGGIVDVPPGVLLCSGITASGTGAITFRGNGRDVSTIRHAPSSTAPMITSSVPVAFRGLTLDGDAANQSSRQALLLHTANTQAFDMADCRITRSANFGIKWQQVNTWVSVRDTEFLNLSEWPGDGVSSSIGIYMGTAFLNTTGVIYLRGLRFLNGAPSTPQAAASGLQLAGDPNGTCIVVGSDISFDYFGANRVGQPSGPLDLYQYFEAVCLDNIRVRHSGCSGIKMGNTRNVVINNVSGQDDLSANDAALVFWSGFARNPAHTYSNVAISNVTAKNWLGYAAVHLVGGAANANNGTKVTLSNINAEGCHHGVDVDGVSDVEITNPQVHGSVAVGAEIAGIAARNITGRVKIHGGIVKGGATYGFLADSVLGGAKFQFDGTTFESNTLHHIRISDPASTPSLVQMRNVNFEGATPTALIQKVTTLALSNCRADQGAPTIATVTTLESSGNTWDEVAFGATANVAVTAFQNFVQADATAVAFTVTLPAASLVARKDFTIKKTDATANAVTIGATVDGVVNPTLATQYKSMTVRSDGIGWNKIASV